MAAQRVAFLASLLLMLPRFGEACVSKSIDVTVPSREIQKDQVISKVDLECCRKGTLQISTTDPDFAVKRDGSLYAKHVLRINRQRNFDIELQDSVTSMPCTIHVRVVFQLNPQVLSRQHVRARRAAILRRQKRRWRPLPFSITENDSGPFPKFIQTINSEYQQNYTIVYHLSGEGVDTSPKGIFRIDSKTGRIYLLQPVDREEYATFDMTVMALTIEGFSREDPLPLHVKVNDVNDNAPKFTKTEYSANVAEGSAIGTIFLKLEATDRDEPNTPRTSLRYKILLQQPGSKYGRLFSVDDLTGEIKTKSDKLDREERDTYTLTVEVRDMEGTSGGLFSKATVVVHVTDANDNPPTFEKAQYTVTVNETVSDIMILCMPVVDKDLANTNASRSVFTITKGNDDGNFKIIADPKTNDGLLYVVKPLDAETTPQIPLEITVGNEIPLTGSSATRQIASVIVKVLDMDEGPEFVPAVKQLWTNENVAKGKLLGSYTARDPESKSSDGIRYRELTDPADWVTIDAKTGAIKTTAALDRESEFVKNNKYNVTVLAIQDGVPPRTGTGTVVINLNDVNDNVPIITNNHLYICENGNRQFVNVSAEDLDATPNSAPFTFVLSDSPPEIQRNWLISEKMGTYAFVRPVNTLPVGYYEVPIVIQDQQHQGKEDILKIMICNCPNNENCAGKLASRSAVLGGMGILVMLLAALLLLCLLLAAVALYCGGDQKKKPSLYPETPYHQSLIVSNEEGGGQQDKNLDALGIPLTLKDNMVISQHYDNQEAGMGHGALSTFSHTGMKGTSGGGMVPGNDLVNINERGVYRETMYSQTDMANANLTTFESNTLSRRNSHNLMDVLRSRVEQVYEEEEEQQELGIPIDYQQEYPIEGAESVNGSVGRYSDVRENLGLEHLNNFEPRFDTLVSMNR
ncbi:desmocollin-3-like [Scyliorhinus canicula]|uniref:desmocollin-3-like n=1 Tax=Scyliorhinus canicula TaxID=7830 RepID=UPI0018F76FF8|nr:desmocollin-3-like [Scyliorhinus canicula]